MTRKGLWCEGSDDDIVRDVNSRNGGNLTTSITWFQSNQSSNTPHFGKPKSL